MLQVGEQRAHRPVQFIEAEEALVAQPRQHLASGHSTPFSTLALSLSRALRQHGHAVVRPGLGRWVDGRVVALGLRNAAAQVVGHPQFGATAEEGQRPHVARYPVRQLLAPGTFDVGVVRRAQHGHEHRAFRISPVLPSVTPTLWPA